MVRVGAEGVEEEEEEAEVAEVAEEEKGEGRGSLAGIQVRI